MNANISHTRAVAARSIACCLLALLLCFWAVPVAPRSAEALTSNDSGVLSWDGV